MRSDRLLWSFGAKYGTFPSGKVALYVFAVAFPEYPNDREKICDRALNDLGSFEIP